MKAILLYFTENKGTEGIKIALAMIGTLTSFVLEIIPYLQFLVLLITLSYTTYQFVMAYRKNKNKKDAKGS
jgi:hypothetical protein